MVAFGEHGLIDAAERRRALRLVAHELFHAWNVCSLRPAEFMLPDLENGSFTDLLWVAEGLTRYYEYVLPVRAGEMPVEDFLKNAPAVEDRFLAVPKVLGDGGGDGLEQVGFAAVEQEGDRKSADGKHTGRQHGARARIRPAQSGAAAARVAGHAA